MRSNMTTRSHHSWYPVRLAATTALATCLLLAMALPTPSQATPPKQKWKYWKTPEAAGFSSASVANAEQIWNQIDDAPVSAFFLVYKGKVRAQFGDVTTDHQCHSVRKSLLSALYGPYVNNGTIDLEATLGELGIDDNNRLTEAEKQARVVDLLRARSGIYLPAACETPGMRASRPSRGSHAPGTYWYYNNWDFNALGTIFRNETDRDIFEDFNSRIAKPIGMQDFDRSRCRYFHEYQFSSHPCYVFRMSARDRARFGQLFLQGGRWGNRQIIPDSWVIDSTSVHSKTRQSIGIPGYDYGLMWWVESPKFFRLAFRDRRLHHLNGFSANGFGGQLILVLPDAEIVAVFAVDVPAGGDLSLGESLPVVETILRGRDIVDLKLAKVQCRERTAVAEETLHLTAKVKNIGTATTRASTVDFFLTAVDGSGELLRLGNVALLQLVSGEVQTLRFDAALSSDITRGRYRLVSTVDSGKNNYDLRRRNNTKILRQALEVQ